MAIDPGSQKCGLAIVDRSSGLIRRMIVAVDDLVETARDLCQAFPVSLIIVGDRTSGKLIRNKIAVLGLPVATVDEDCSTMEGRRRYLQENTKGLARLLPVGLRSPARPFDDYVAEILAERYFKAHPV